LIAKLHTIDSKSILAICDKDLIGKEFEDGKIFFRASEKFYGNQEFSEKEIIEMALESDSINVFGNKSSELLEREGLISENNVIIIAGIKHAQLYKI